MCCLVNRRTMGVNSLLKTATRQSRGCDLYPGPTAPESSTLATWLPSHLQIFYKQRSASVHGSKNCGGSTSVHGRLRSPHISGGRRWLSCRQPACLLPRQLRRGTDRRTDRAIPKCPPPLGQGHSNDECTYTQILLLLHRLTASFPEQPVWI